MSVRYNYWTGHSTERFVPLKRCISAMTRRNNSIQFKIGITNDPDRRWRQEYKGEYSRMEVIYVTTSARRIRQIEKHLTQYYVDWCNNIRFGGGGAMGTGPYYLYVVLAPMNP